MSANVSTSNNFQCLDIESEFPPLHTLSYLPPLTGDTVSTMSPICAKFQYCPQVTEGGDGDLLFGCHRRKTLKEVYYEKFGIG